VNPAPGGATSTGAPSRGAAPRRTYTPHALLLPALGALVLVFLIPIVYGIWTSFLGEAAGATRWVGVAHYAALLSDPAFWHALGVSVLFTAGSVVGTYALGLGAALLLHQQFPGHRAVGAALVLPWAMPYVAAGLVWSWLFDYQYGLISYLMERAGPAHHPVGWLIDPHLALWAVTLVQTWKLFPFAMVMLLAGLKAIPGEVVEAARMDGAGTVRVFWFVIVPGLRSVTSVLVLLLSIWSFGRAFTILYVLTGGGPAHATETLVVQTFLQGFQYFHLEAAAALGTVVMAISAVFTCAYLAVLYREPA
jgi:multiple sugar transport system permease protein